MNLFGNEQPEGYRQGIPKDEIEAQRKKDAEIKKLNDLLEAIKILKQQNIEGNRVVDALEQTIKQKDVRINSLENALAAKDFENTALVNTIFPHIKTLEESVEILTKADSSQKHTIDSLVSLVEEQNEKFDGLEDKFDGKFDAVLVKLNVLENKTEAIHTTVRTIPVEIITEVSKISTTQTDRIVSEIAELPSSDELDAIVRTRVGETTDITNTKIVSEISKIQVPTTTIDITPALENMKSGIITALDEKTQYLDEGQGGMIERIKEHIDAIPKPEAPNMQEFSDKIIHILSEKIEGETDITFDYINDFVVDELKLLNKHSNEPSKMPPMPSNAPIEPEPEISEPEEKNHYPDSLNEDIEEQSSNIEDLKPSNDPSNDPSKVSTVLSNEPSNTSNDTDIELKSSNDPSKVSTMLSNEPSNTSNDTDIELKPSNDPSNEPTMLSNDDEFKELSPNQQKVAKYIKNNPNQSQKEISEALNMDRGTLSKVLKFLIDEKYIIKSEEDTYILI